MLNCPQQPSPASPSRLDRPSLALLATACLLTSGCVTRRPATPRLGAIVLSHPVAPVPVALAEDIAPDIPLDIERAPQFGIGRPTPPRVRTSAPPAPERTPVEKAAEPTLAPELTAEELTAAKADTERSLIVAERNLGFAEGRSLNPAQQDLLSKIRGFVDSARDAMKQQDWQRARSQAHKAEILSQEFAPNP